MFAPGVAKGGAELWQKREGSRDAPIGLLGVCFEGADEVIDAEIEELVGEAEELSV